MPPKFGTSGLRGLVTELTDELIADHVRAFIAACEMGTGLFVGRDLRPSSPHIAGVVIATARAAGLSVTDCGDAPTPALALAAMSAGAAAVMVTGSHIPADRNGLKFYLPTGEIGKAHEAAILAARGAAAATGPQGPLATQDTGPAYVARYHDAFGLDALTGLRVGAYTHSTVGRDMMCDILRALGAEVVELGRSDTFIPVDTEAVDPETRATLREWAAQHGVDAIVSMDGDGDRPLLTDAAGNVVPGDVLGQITAQMLGAQTVVTPVSSNTGVELGGQFAQVLRTRIGSPFVIAGMEETGGQVAGYEANGGFLLGFTAKAPAGALPPLMTRDSMLPLVAVLTVARGQGVAAAVAAQPARFTAADRLQEVPTERALALVQRLAEDRDERQKFLNNFNALEESVNQVDGLRIALADARIVHVRPSGNAPELRFYAEADSAAAADETLAQGLAVLRRLLS